MDLLPLLDECIVLRDSLEGQLVHKVDDVLLLEKFVLEGLDGDWEGGREKHDLALFGQEGDELLNNLLKVLREELVGLVHDHDLAT